MSGGKGGGYRRCFEAFSDDIVANLSSSKMHYVELTMEKEMGKYNETFNS